MAGATRFVRIKLEHVAQTDEVMLIDAKLDENNKIIGGWPLYGRSIEYDGNNLGKFPIAVEKDGEIDFGSGADSYSTNLRERSIVPLELCTVWGDGDQGKAGGAAWTYRIRSVSVLGEA